MDFLSLAFTLKNVSEYINLDFASTKFSTDLKKLSYTITKDSHLYTSPLNTSRVESKKFFKK